MGISAVSWRAIYVCGCGWRLPSPPVRIGPESNADLAHHPFSSSPSLGGRSMLFQVAQMRAMEKVAVHARTCQIRKRRAVALRFDLRQRHKAVALSARLANGPFPAPNSSVFPWTYVLPYRSFVPPLHLHQLHGNFVASADVAKYTSAG